MYFTPLFGPTLWRVPTKYLHDRSLRSEEVAAHAEAVVRIPPVTGITADAAGNLYLSALTEDGVLKLGPDGHLQTLIRDERISGPNEGSIGPDGFYYFPNSQDTRQSPVRGVQDQGGMMSVALYLGIDFQDVTVRIAEEQRAMTKRAVRRA